MSKKCWLLLAILVSVVGVLAAGASPKPLSAASGAIDVSPVKNITSTGDASGNGYYERDPQMLEVSSGTWYLIYSRSQTTFSTGGNPDDLKCDVYYQTSGDSGATWSVATKVLDAAAIGTNADFRSATITEVDGKIWVIGANLEALKGDIYANTYSSGSWSGQSKVFDGTYDTGAFHVDAIAEGDDDADGLLNTWEVCKWGTDPAKVDTDADGKGDCKETVDTDGNGIVDFGTDALNSARAALVPAGVGAGKFGKDGDFDLDGNGVIDFGGDTLTVARFALGVWTCK